MKQSIAALACAAALTASLAACGGGDDTKAAPPRQTVGPSPSTTATSGPSMTPTSGPTASSGSTATSGPTASSGPTAAPPLRRPTTTVPLMPTHSTYSYRGLKLVVNLPADISAASLPRMRNFSAFLQSLGRTTAQNKVDPSLSKLASPAVVKYIRTFIEPGSVQGVGSLTITVSTAQTLAPGPTQITGCLRSKLVQVRKNGSRYVDPITKKYPTLTMTASVSPQNAVLPVDQFAFAAGKC